MIEEALSAFEEESPHMYTQKGLTQAVFQILHFFSLLSYLSLPSSLSLISFSLVFFSSVFVLSLLF